MIVLNTIWVGVELEAGRDAAPGTVMILCAIIGHFFGLNFIAEVVVRLAAEGPQFIRGPNYAWNLFDAVLISSSAIEIIIDFFAFVGGGDVSGQSGLNSMRIVRVIRITRLVRLLRVARIVRFIRALNLLVVSIILTMRSLLWAVVLLGFIVYLFAIVVCQGVTSYLQDQCQHVECPDQEHLEVYWGSLLRACLSLFLMLVGMSESWDNVCRALEYIDPLLAVVVLFYIVVCQFAVLNVVTGVFCQGAIEGAQKDRESVVHHLLSTRKVYYDTLREQFAAMFKRLKTTTDGTVSFEDFKDQFETQAVHEYFALLDLDISDAYMLFTLLDEDESGGIDIEEFVEGCLRLKGAARSIDLAILERDIRVANTGLASEIRGLREVLGKQVLS